MSPLQQTHHWDYSTKYLMENYIRGLCHKDKISSYLDNKDSIYHEAGNSYKQFVRHPQITEK